MSINHLEIALDIVRDAILDLRDISYMSISELAEPEEVGEADIAKIKVAVYDFADQLDAALEEEGA